MTTGTIATVLCLLSLTGCGTPPMSTPSQGPSSFAVLSEVVEGPAKKGINEALGFTGTRQITDDSGIVIYIAKPRPPGATDARAVDSQLYVIYPGEGTRKQLDLRNSYRHQGLSDAEAIRRADSDLYESNRQVAAVFDDVNKVYARVKAHKSKTAVPDSSTARPMAPSPATKLVASTP